MRIGRDGFGQQALSAYFKWTNEREMPHMHQTGFRVISQHHFRRSAKECYGWEPPEVLCRFDPATDHFDMYPSPNGQYIGDLQQDDSGNFWAINFEGVYRFYPSTGKFVFFPVVTPEGKQSSLPMSVCIDSMGIVWVSTYGDGLFRMDPRKPGQFEAYNPGGSVHKIAYEIYLAA